jgi:PEP-CTERM motif
MKIKQITSAAALCVGAAMSLPASAASISNVDGSFSPWAGFDWQSAGTAFTTGFTGVAGSNFDLTIFAVAGALNKLPTGTFTAFDGLIRMDTSADGVSAGLNAYEYTLVAKVTEQIVSCDATSCTFSILSGVFDIYYDTSPEANGLAGGNGTGYLDGVKIISGTFGAQSGGTFTTSGNGSNSTTVAGTVTFTNALYVNPQLATTNATTTLQLGTAITGGWVNPGGFNGAAFGAGEIVMQADANQSFVERVPEPGTLSLLALALLGGGAAARRRKTQQ